MKRITDEVTAVPWNKDRLIGQKSPLTLRYIWAIRIRLQLAGKVRDLALFNLAIDSKLRGCDLVSLKVGDVAMGRSVLPRAIVMQQKNRRPVQFEITEQTRQSVLAWIDKAKLGSGQFLFPSRIAESPHLSTRQYARIVAAWVESIGLDPGSVRNSFNATDEGNIDIPTDEKSPWCSAPSRAYQAGNHGALPWH